MSDEDSEDSWEGYQSGPFCRHHWADPDCDECRKLCVCGDSLAEHLVAEESDDIAGACECCDCPTFRPDAARGPRTGESNG